MSHGPILLHGSFHPALGAAVARTLGQQPGQVVTERYPDGEHQVEVLEDVRGRDVFILQSLGAPPGEHLLELLLLADACRRAGAERLVALIPYLAFARQDRRERVGEPLGARLVADLISARFDRAVLMDLHSPAVEGAFTCPVEQLFCQELFVPGLLRTDGRPQVVVSADLGASKRAERLGRALGLDVAVVHKRRLSGSTVRARAVVGEVEGLAPILVDDMISTAGTVQAAVQVLLDAGCAPDITVCASHGLFVPPAHTRLSGLPVTRIVVTDSLPPPQLELPIEIVSVAPLLAEAVLRIHGQRSASGDALGPKPVPASDRRP
jgi:ribose-phosphate pyrophosphokinase